MTCLRAFCLFLAGVLLASVLLAGDAAASTPGTAKAPQSGPGSEPAAGSPVRVVASIHPISALVKEVGGNKVDLTTIIPPGADPHHFELTPGKARALHEAKAILLIGGHFDEWILPHAGEHQTAYMLVRFSEAFTDSLIPLENSFNPHFWLDPMFAREMTRIIAVALCTVDFDNCEYYRARAAELIEDLDGLRITGRERLTASGFTAFVALHPAWTYFARRFGITEVATLEIGHESEPSARHIADVIRKMTSGEVKFVIAEEFSGLDLARSVAEQTGAEMILLDPLGDENKPDRNTYPDLFNHNLTLIESSAKRQGP